MRFGNPSLVSDVVIAGDGGWAEKTFHALRAFVRCDSEHHTPSIRSHTCRRYTWMISTSFELRLLVAEPDIDATFALHFDTVEKSAELLRTIDLLHPLRCQDWLDT